MDQSCWSQVILSSLNGAVYLSPSLFDFVAKSLRNASLVQLLRKNFSVRGRESASVRAVRFSVEGMLEDRCTADFDLLPNIWGNVYYCRGWCIWFYCADLSYFVCQVLRCLLQNSDQSFLESHSSVVCGKISPASVSVSGLRSTFLCDPAMWSGQKTQKRNTEAAGPHLCAAAFETAHNNTEISPNPSPVFLGVEWARLSQIAKTTYWLTNVSEGRTRRLLRARSSTPEQVQVSGCLSSRHSHTCQMVVKIGRFRRPGSTHTPSLRDDGPSPCHGCGKPRCAFRQHMCSVTLHVADLRGETGW